MKWIMKCPLLLFGVLLLIVIQIHGCMSRSSSKPNRHQNHNKPKGSTKQESGSGSGDNVQCKDESGNNVPWFIAYKLPKLRGAPGPTFKEGSGYSYILPGYNAWRPSVKDIGNANSIVGHTLRPYLKNERDLAYIVYNDQPPYRDDFGYNGHTKGMVLAKKNGGLWLVHTVPKFPLAEADFYPPNGLVNAQMFLCLTLTTAEIDSVAGIFKLTRPHVGNSSIPDPLKASLPTWKSFLAIKRFSGKGIQNKVFKLSAGGLDFHVYAKSPKFDKEIYVEWLAPSLRSSLEVQSWLSGINAFVSNCTASVNFPVYNIAEKKVEGQVFTRNDHSKWAVGNEVGNPWTCVSDLNRMEGQKSRGGATLCVSNQRVWTAFNSAVLDLQPCQRNNG